jgi:hypothetical protein
MLTYRTENPTERKRMSLTNSARAYLSDAEAYAYETAEQARDTYSLSTHEAASVAAIMDAFAELAAQRAAEDAEPPPGLDNVRAAIRAAMDELTADDLARIPLGMPNAESPAARMRALAEAYVRLGGDLELAPALAEPVSRDADFEALAQLATGFVANLPGLDDALAYADELYAKLDAKRKGEL